MSRPNVWLLGDIDHRDFADAVAWLGQNTVLNRHASPASALGATHRDAIPPAAIVLAVARPGRFQAAEIEQLHRSEPLARLVALVGSLGEGEVRSGTPWPGVTRIYGHQWRARLPRALGIGFRDGAASVLPRTLSVIDEGEQFARAKAPQRDALIVIRTSNIATYETLADACVLAGYRSVWLPPQLPLLERGADAILLDSDGAPGDGAASSGLPTVVLLNFPRSEDIDRARAAGASAVVAKPFQLVDLWAALEVALETREAARR